MNGITKVNEPGEKTMTDESEENEHKNCTSKWISHSQEYRNRDLVGRGRHR